MFYFLDIYIYPKMLVFQKNRLGKCWLTRTFTLVKMLLLSGYERVNVVVYKRSKIKIVQKNIFCWFPRCYLRCPSINLYVWTCCICKQLTTWHGLDLEKKVSSLPSMASQFNLHLTTCTWTKLIIYHLSLANYSYLYLKTFIYEPVELYCLFNSGFHK